MARSGKSRAKDFAGKDILRVGRGTITLAGQIGQFHGTTVQCA
jgi:hypothetical protein